MNNQNNILQSSTRSFNSRKIHELNSSWGLLLENYAKNLTSKEIFFHDYLKEYEEKSDNHELFCSKISIYSYNNIY
jgi:hypothetical protein